MDAIDRAKHQLSQQLGFLSGVLDQLVSLQRQGCRHFQLVHGEGLANAVSECGVGETISGIRRMMRGPQDAMKKEFTVKIK